MPWVALAGAALSAGVNAAAGSGGNKSSQSTTLNLGNASGLENLLYGSGSRKLKPQQQQLFDSFFKGMGMSAEQAFGKDPDAWTEDTKGGSITSGYQDLASLYSKGPGEADVTAGYGAQRDLASMLDEYSKTGGMPSQADYRNAEGFFAPRQTLLNNMFQDQSTASDRTAARLGRPVNDPILQAKLRTGFMRQQDELNAQKQDFAGGLVGKRIGLQTDRTNILGNLASQAFANRTAILSLGSQLGNQERDFRLRAAGSNTSSVSGGGLQGALTGGMNGLAGGLQLGNSLSNLFSSGATNPMQQVGGGAATGAMAGWGGMGV